MGRSTQGFAVAVVLALSLVEAGEARKPEGRSAGETPTLEPTTLGDAGTALAAYTGTAGSGGTQVFCPLVRKSFFDNNSGFSIQNLNASAIDVTVEFFTNQSTPVHTENTTIPAFSPSYFNIADISGLGSGFQGSLVATSSQQMAVIVNDYDGATAAAYGCKPPSSTVDLPANFCGGFGFNTRWALQNAGSSTASVVISLSGGATQGMTVPPNVSRIFTLDTVPGINCSANFFQSAQISSDQPIVVTVENFWNSGQSRGQYGGASADGNTMFLPLVKRQYFGYTSGLVVQNIGTSSDTFEITYESDPGSTENVTLNAGEVGFGSNVFTLPSGYLGHAVVTAGEPSSLLNEIAVGGGIDIDSAYAGGSGLSGRGPTVVLPMLFKSGRPSGPGQQWNGFLQVTNLDSTSTPVTVTFFDQGGNSFMLSAAPLHGVGQPAGGNLGGGESVLIDLATVDDTQLPDGIYSAVVESNGADLAAAALITVAGSEIFLDGFESGDTSSWSASVP